jgi:RNA polymerase sigma factor (TIGR02999 family)
MSSGPDAHPTGREDLDQQRIDDLLGACAGNDQEASRHLFALLYDDLKRVARRQLRSEHEAHTLGATALVHETYLKFSGAAGKDWRGRAHFLAIASRAMRQVLVDHARRRGAEKRGGGQVHVTLSTDAGSVASSVSLDVLALSEALDRLGERDERLVRLVECRFFGALTAEETASVLGVSLRTVERDWTRARLYLAHLLQPADNG